MFPAEEERSRQSEQDHGNDPMRQKGLRGHVREAAAALREILMI